MRAYFLAACGYRHPHDAGASYGPPVKDRYYRVINGHGILGISEALLSRYLESYHPNFDSPRGISGRISYTRPEILCFVFS